MNILIPDSWLRDFLETTATPKEIQTAISLCGAGVERLHKVGSDYVYDIEITTNRPDMMSVIGIAKEAVAALPQFGQKAKLIANPLRSLLEIPTETSVDYLTVSLDPKLCPRFSAILLQDVNVGPSPDKISKRLELAGMRGLNNVIDISNYLMVELGQPVHTFDYDKISKHKMIVRESRNGEKLETLDGQTRSLPGGDIVIEDGGGRLIDLCGIMGGQNSSIDENTKNVLLFVQTYEPVHIRRTSMALAHRTAAAVLFEKGTPIENVPPTLAYGISLFKDLTGGRPASKVLDILNTKPLPDIVELTTPLVDFVNKRLGIVLAEKQINQILESLGFEVLAKTKIQVPPERRLDVTIPEDLVEEVARIYGYHNLPNQLMAGALPTNRDDRFFYWEQKLKSALSHWGFTETYTYSLIESNMEKNPQALRVENPLTEDLEVLRTSLTPSHLKTIRENIGKQSSINLFEIANVYIPKSRALPIEELHLVISSTDRDVSHIKGVLESVYAEMGISYQNSEILTHTDPRVVTAEINLMKLIPIAKTEKSFTPISKYSPIVEDINFILGEKTSFSELAQKIMTISPNIQTVSLVDRYGHKLTLRITYQNDKKQLSSQDIEPIRQKLLSL